MNPFYGRPFQGEIILWDIRWYWHNPKELSSWHIDETYLKVNGQWSYLYRTVDQYGYTIDFYLSSRRNTKSAYCFLGKIFNNVKKWKMPQVINTDKSPIYGCALSRLKHEGKCPLDLEHRQIKNKNNVSECDHSKLKLKANYQGDLRIQIDEDGLCHNQRY